MDINQVRALRYHDLPADQAAFIYYRIREDTKDLKQGQMAIKISLCLGTAISLHRINNWDLWECLGVNYSKEFKSQRYENLKKDYEVIIRVCEVKEEHFRNWPEGPRWDKLLPDLKKNQGKKQEDLPQSVVNGINRAFEEAERKPAQPVQYNYHAAPDWKPPPYTPRVRMVDPTYQNVKVDIGEEGQPEQMNPVAKGCLWLGIGILVLIFLAEYISSLPYRTQTIPTITSIPPTVRPSDTPRPTPHGTRIPLAEYADFDPTPVREEFAKVVIAKYCYDRGFGNEIKVMNGEYTCNTFGRNLTQEELNDVCRYWMPAGSVNPTGLIHERRNPDSFWCWYK